MRGRLDPKLHLRVALSTLLMGCVSSPPPPAGERLVAAADEAGGALPPAVDNTLVVLEKVKYSSRKTPRYL